MKYIKIDFNNMKVYKHFKSIFSSVSKSASSIVPEWKK